MAKPLPDAAHAKVLEVMPLAYKYCHEYANRCHLDVEDLKQEAYFAVAEAWRYWRPDGGANWASYAKTCVVRYLYTLCREQQIQRERFRPSNVDAETLVVHPDCYDPVADCLGALPPRVAVLASVILQDGRPKVNRAADELGIPRKVLQAELEEYFG